MEWYYSVLIGLIIPSILGIWAGARKMVKTQRIRAKRLEKYNPKTCILHGNQLDDLDKKVGDMQVESKLATRAMFEWLTKEKYGQTNGTFDALYEEYKDHLTNK